MFNTSLYLSKKWHITEDIKEAIETIIGTYKFVINPQKCNSEGDLFYSNENSSLRISKTQDSAIKLEVTEKIENDYYQLICMEINTLTKEVKANSKVYDKNHSVIIENKEYLSGETVYFLDNDYLRYQKATDWSENLKEVLEPDIRICYTSNHGIRIYEAYSLIRQKSLSIYKDFYKNKNYSDPVLKISQEQIMNYLRRIFHVGPKYCEILSKIIGKKDYHIDNISTKIYGTDQTGIVLTDPSDSSKITIEIRCDEIVLKELKNFDDEYTIRKTILIRGEDVFAAESELCVVGADLDLTLKVVQNENIIEYYNEESTSFIRKAGANESLIRAVNPDSKIKYQSEQTITDKIMFAEDLLKNQFQKYPVIKYPESNKTLIVSK